ncbi:ewing's tumor-associated antigen 1 [Cottoperca gobio]|uniref:Ewing's tumor-associated antigen 1 n=1 Tax=Cottoperca gobio TaxID=56716 RepID=A0A6J2QBF8_COTGO|nr:ewing's tumor-associated antigen 1 homolog [Cottoperca gobio]
MNQSRRKIDPPSGPQQQTAPVKTNRLRRSFRQTQAEVDSPKSQQPEFKSPTRIPRSRASVGFTLESPHNDSDFQQDIIWDATSPSPNRLGKRGKKQPVGVVDISEIVSRIAPKHGRPKVAEPTLQQWIGDTIPCTPDVQVPRHKKKSPRPNAVDDLLKLAKQFDFNMFHQDEEEEEEEKDPQSLEVPSDDILDFENREQNDVSSSLPRNSQPAVKTDVQLHLDQDMEDDLDFLFDGPTQQLSGNLSRVSSAQPSQVKPASKEASGKPSAPSHGVTSSVSTAITEGSPVKDEFDDDWENDDLLNDSLVLAMTQNPQNFAAPKHSSTQKPPSQVRDQRESQANVVQSAVSKVEKNNVRQRTTFKLEPNPTRTNSKVDYSLTAADAPQKKFGNGVLTAAGSQRASQTSDTVKSEPPTPPFHRRTSAAKYNTTSSTASNTSVLKPAQSFPIKPALVSSHSEAAAASDLLEEDMSFFFASDPVWDDLADDDLLCELCEDVENQVQSGENVATVQTLPGGHMSKQRASLQPSNRNPQPASRQPFAPQNKAAASLPCASGRPAGSSWPGGFVSNIAAGVQKTDSFRYTQAKNISGSTNGSACVHSAPQGTPRQHQFTFKKPNNPVCTGTNNVLGKCSAAEIEQKKQQAMEKRRQRLQATQNLRAPT